jgi:hypothetical protein
VQSDPIELDSGAATELEVGENEPQNIEQEISNDEVWNRCAQSFLNVIMIEYPASIFVVSCSIFDICFFRFSFIDQTVRFSAIGWSDT